MDRPHWILRVMDVFTPTGVDGFLLGLVVSLGSAVLFAYWWWSL
jgi:hypothetical protein